jgi:MFS family permease
MAHAAPASSASGSPRTSRTARTTGTSGSPDVFGARAHAVANWAVPVVGGLVYGYWAAAINRDAGRITGWNILFGFVCALAFGLLYAGVHAVAPRLPRELHALLWSVFAGVAFGFLHSQTDASVLRSTFMSLGVAAGVFAATFYRYYTREDGVGGRPKRSPADPR